MNSRKRVAAGIIPLLISGLVLPLFAHPRISNCGGNGARLSACTSVAAAFKMVALDRGGKSVSVTNLDEREQDHFRLFTDVSWLHGLSIRVRPWPVQIGAGSSKEIIAVCDTPFDNIPRRLIGRSPMRHAVAYSDGSVGLISVQEFQRSDFSRFIDLRNVQNLTVEPVEAPNERQSY